MVKYNDNARHIHRLPPCPVYDIEGFQSWLGDMAQQGHLLDRDGFFMGFASFEVAQPCKMSYRLQAARHPKAAFDEGEPDAEEAELSSAMGWDYVARKGEFHIYRSAAPEARELNTDPDVQAMALKKVSAGLRSNMLISLFWMILYPFLLLNGRAVMLIITLGEWFALCALLVLVWSLIRSLGNIRRLRRLQKRLQLGEALHEKSDWRSRSARHYASLAVSIAVYCIFAVTLGSALIYGLSKEYEQPIESLSQPPFATIADFYPDAEYSQDDAFAGLGLNTVESYSAIIAPVNYYWRESADLSQNGEVFSASYYLWYHETAAPWLARILALEHQGEDIIRRDFEEIPLSVPGADYAVAWRDEVHFTNLVIQKGNVVVMATLLQYGKDQLSLDEWAAILANSIG